MSMCVCVCVPCPRGSTAFILLFSCNCLRRHSTSVETCSCSWAVILKFNFFTWAFQLSWSTQRWTGGKKSSTQVNFHVQREGRATWHCGDKAVQNKKKPDVRFANNRWAPLSLYGQHTNKVLQFRFTDNKWDKSSTWYTQLQGTTTNHHLWGRFSGCACYQKLSYTQANCLMNCCRGQQSELGGFFTQWLGPLLQPLCFLEALNTA